MEEKKFLEEQKQKLKELLKTEKGIDLVYGEFALIPAETIVETERLKLEIEKLRELVYKDELTGALNRRGFMEQVEPLFNEALHAKKKPQYKRKFEVGQISVLYLDGDNFKEINDSYGHDVGDFVLKELCRIMRDSVRDVDAVGRMGGEEFVIALVGASEEDAFKKAEEIRDRIEREVKIANNILHKVTVSVGVASLAESDADNFDELLAYADQAMYEAKVNRGKNNTVKFSELKTA